MSSKEKGSMLLFFSYLRCLLFPPNFYRAVVISTDGLDSRSQIGGIQGLQIRRIRDTGWEWVTGRYTGAARQDRISRPSLFQPGLIIHKKERIVFLQHDLLQLFVRGSRF